MCAVAMLPVVHIAGKYSAVCKCACARCVCALDGCKGTLVVALRRPAVFIARPVTGGRTRVRFALATRPFAPVAAGVSWALVIANAQWAARAFHTTVMINATGAIYVIGGVGGGSTNYNDVWVSTDGGADRTREGGTRRVLGCAQGGTLWYTQGYSMVL
jgi:hypothetical protein